MPEDIMSDDEYTEDTADIEDKEQTRAPLAQALPIAPLATPVVPLSDASTSTPAFSESTFSEPAKKSSWNWIGSSSRPSAQKGDGISDLFRTDFDEDLEDVNDLVTVDTDRDILDAGHDGTLDDLVDVFPEDIMGMGSTGQKPSRQQLRRLRAERKARRSQDGGEPSAGGLRG